MHSISEFCKKYKQEIEKFKKDINIDLLWVLSKYDGLIELDFNYSNYIKIFQSEDDQDPSIKYAVNFSRKNYYEVTEGDILKPGSFRDIELYILNTSYTKYLEYNDLVYKYNNQIQKLLDSFLDSYSEILDNSSYAGLILENTVKELQNKIITVTGIYKNGYIEYIDEDHYSRNDYLGSMIKVKDLENDLTLLDDANSKGLFV